jgi:hypothetical protein
VANATTAFHMAGDAGGGGGIRTHGAVADARDFQSRPLGLYGTPPGFRRPARASRATSERRFASLPGLPRRKGRDSNPRRPFRRTAFRERRLKPLGHPSAAHDNTPGLRSQAIRASLNETSLPVGSVRLTASLAGRHTTSARRFEASSSLSSE